MVAFTPLPSTYKTLEKKTKYLQYPKLFLSRFSNELFIRFGEVIPLVFGCHTDKRRMSSFFFYAIKLRNFPVV